MVHPCGSGAFGFFETTKDVSHLTKANFLSGKGVKTPIFMRFSTVTLGREFPDTARNPRGFAIKFYTGEGNYDIVGLNWVTYPPCSLSHSRIATNTHFSPSSSAATQSKAPT